MKDSQTYAIIGAAMEVHRVLGCGFLEHVYQLALAHELQCRSIPYSRETGIPIHYKGVLLDAYYRADFVCYGDIIVELKAVSELSAANEAQALHYLKATCYQRALLINFGEEKLVYKRFSNNWNPEDSNNNPQ